MKKKTHTQKKSQLEISTSDRPSVTLFSCRVTDLCIEGTFEDISKQMWKKGKRRYSILINDTKYQWAG